jgi:hypothetical protein
MNHFTCKSDRTNGNIEFLQLYPVVATDAVFETGLTIVSAVLSLNWKLSQTNISFDVQSCLLGCTAV